MKKFQIKRINIYLAKSFFIKFLQISLAFSLLIFFVNFLESLDKSNKSDVPLHITFAMAFLQIPDFLNDIAPSLVLFAAIVTFFSLSLKSEITVVRSSGLSLWSIASPVAISAFLLGVFWVLIFNQVSILMLNKFDYLEGKYIKNELREVVEANHGIWLKQTNVEKPQEEIIIEAKRVYKESLEFDDVLIWFFDENGKFYRKLDVKKMSLQNDSWNLAGAVINDTNSLNRKVDSYVIPTNLKADFVMDRVVSNFQNVKSFSLFALPNIISSLQEAGLQSSRFEVYFQSLISKPLLFLAMSLVACYFGINHARNQAATIRLFLGIVFGLALYISLSFIGALGSSRIIPVFASTWVVTFVCLAIGILLIYRKDYSSTS